MEAGGGRAPRALALAGGVVLAVVAGLASRALGMQPSACWTAAVTALCAVWWVTEPVPIAVTSLLPFAVFPFTGVMDHAEVARAYGHTLILLLLGGFILSTAMERSGAHRRLAVAMVRLVGGHSRRRLVLGFMLATGLISMWISNTATTLMMLPVAIAAAGDSEDDQGLRAPLLLGIAYAASIGGMGTPVGTPPNIIFMGAYEAATGTTMSFLSWMAIGLPVVVLLLPVSWWLLTRRVPSGPIAPLPALGRWKPKERRVLVVFALTALAWITRTEPAGGWAGLVGAGASDSTVALVAVIVLFLVPDGEGGELLDWATANRIPWGLLLLFGGGIAIAQGFETSGLSVGLGELLGGITAWPVIVMMAAVCLSVTFLTEVTSNTATATLLMPIMAAIGLAAGVDPAFLMIPAALSASCAFMLPVATAPNAIVFATGHVTTRRMARQGFAVNLAGAGVITVACYLLIRGS